MTCLASVNIPTNGPLRRRLHPHGSDQSSIQRNKQTASNANCPTKHLCTGPTAPIHPIMMYCGIPSRLPPQIELLAYQISPDMLYRSGTLPPDLQATDCQPCRCSVVPVLNSGAIRVAQPQSLRGPGPDQTTTCDKAKRGIHCGRSLVSAVGGQSHWSKLTAGNMNMYALLSLNDCG